MCREEEKQQRHDSAVIASSRTSACLAAAGHMTSCRGRLTRALSDGEGVHMHVSPCRRAQKACTEMVFRRVGPLRRREFGRKTVVCKINFIFMVAHMQFLVHD